MIEVFPVGPSFAQMAEILRVLGIPLLVLFFIISIGIHALRTFESISFETKMFNFVLCSIFISIWPDVLLQLKNLVAEFNSILVVDVFKMSWNDSFGQSLLDQMARALTENISVLNLPLKLINTALVVLLNAAYKIIHVFFLLFFFFYAALGPVVIARGVFSDEIGVFLELVREVIVLLLWQSSFIIVIALIDKTVGTTSGFVTTPNSGASAYSHMGYAVLLVVVILFIPIFTRKVAVNIGLGVMSPLARVGATMIGLGAMNKALQFLAGPAGALGSLGMPLKAAAGSFAHSQHYVSEAIGFAEEMRLHSAHEKAEHELHQTHAAHGHGHEDHGDHEEHDGHGEHAEHHEEHHHAEHHADHHEEHHEDHGGSHGHSSGHGHGGGHGGHESHGEEHHGGQGHASSATEEPWVLPGSQADRPAMKNFMKELFGKSGKANAEKVQRIKLLRQQILLIRGPKDSDKYRDIANLGIHHEDYFEDSPKKLEEYRDQLDRFNTKFGGLYDYQGAFIGKEPHLRPRSWDQSESQGPESSPEA